MITSPNRSVRDLKTDSGVGRMTATGDGLVQFVPAMMMRLFITGVEQ